MEKPPPIPPASIPHPPLLLTGPTAVGKSELALLLAEKVGGEIVSVDSMQVYRGLDIGTAKPSLEERARVPHHLIDIIGLAESFDAAQFVKLAAQSVTEIHARGHVPILCGGTGLYFKALLEGLGGAPPRDNTVRAQLEATPLPELLSELANRDPVAFEKIDRKNPRRVVRALEVIRLTGKPFSAQRANWSHASRLTPHGLGLSRSPGDLWKRIDARVDEMFRQGLVAETEALLNCGLEQNQTAMQALGYRQVVEHLRGKRSLAETIDLVKIRTRQFAKRQMTWFRRQLALQWIHLGTDETPAAALQQILSAISPGERIGH
jgi:tRNA dimethylallyltransferase